MQTEVAEVTAVTNRRAPVKRKRGKIVKITVVGEDGVEYEVDAKECTKCGETKEMDKFSLKKDGLGGRSSRCRVCIADYDEDYREINRVKVQKRKQRHYQSNRKRVLEKNRRYYDENRERVLEQDLRYYEENRGIVLERNRRWGKQNKDARRIIDLRRRARKESLPDTLLLSELDNGYAECALTGDVDSVHLDHVIPLSTGHGGTVYGNIIPLRGDLNMSKQDANLFEWFEANRQRFEITEERFHSVVYDLAAQNGMTPDEYRQFVDWCHANQRSDDEIRADNERYGYKKPSHELWREATGIQFPIRVDSGDLSLTNRRVKPKRTRNVNADGQRQAIG